MTTTTSAVPFSPVPAHTVDMRFRHDRDLTRRGCPLVELWQENYRSACLRLIWGHEDEARVLARTGMAMEDAYIQRVGDEVRAGKR